MSHYVVYALLDKSAVNGDPQLTQTALEELLAPYNEEIQVEEYDVECYCIGLAAKNATQEASAAKFGTWDDFRKAFWTPDREAVRKERNDTYFAWIKNGKVGECPPTPFDDLFEDEWKAYVAPRVEFEEATFNAHPDKDKPKPDCLECSGTGKYKSQYNPKSKWDWWVIGGRWDGCINGITEDSTPNAPTFSLNNRHSNHLAVEELLTLSDEEFEKRRPFAVVTSEGWFEKGKMGWWAMVSDDKGKEAWVAEYRALLEKNSDKIAIAIDCHI